MVSTPLSLLSAILPVLATSITPNLFSDRCRASVLPGSPAALRVTASSLTSTTYARMTLARVLETECVCVCMCVHVYGCVCPCVCMIVCACE